MDAETDVKASRVSQMEEDMTRSRIHGAVNESASSHLGQVTVQDIKEGKIALMEEVLSPSKKRKKKKHSQPQQHFVRVLSKDEALMALPANVKRRRIWEIDQELAASRPWPQSQYPLFQNIPEETLSTPPAATNVINAELESDRFFHSVMAAPDSLAAQRTAA